MSDQSMAEVPIRRGATIRMCIALVLRATLCVLDSVAVRGQVTVTPGAPSGQPVVYVRAGATGAGDGTSWTDAYPELRLALQAVVPPVELWVAEGTYVPTTDTDRTATFRLISGIALYGGFAGTEITRDERDWQVNLTVLSGEIGNPSDLSDNACHVITGSGTDSTAVLDGFSVTGGRAASCTLNRGGGMLNEAGSPSVRQVRFYANVAGAGGGMYNINGSAPQLQNVAFEGNSVGSGGGVLGTMIVVRCSLPSRSAATARSAEEGCSIPRVPTPSALIACLRATALAVREAPSTTRRARRSSSGRPSLETAARTEAGASIVRNACAMRASSLASNDHRASGRTA